LPSTSNRQHKQQHRLDSWISTLRLSDSKTFLQEERPIKNLLASFFWFHEYWNVNTAMLFTGMLKSSQLPLPIIKIWSMLLQGQIDLLFSSSSSNSQEPPLWLSLTLILFANTFASNNAAFAFTSVGVKI